MSKMFFAIWQSKNEKNIKKHKNMKKLKNLECENTKYEKYQKVCKKERHNAKIKKYWPEGT